jgi:hypothetical protein
MSRAVKEWSVDEVVSWLEDNELSRVAPFFEDELVDGEALLLLESSDLAELGLKLGERKKLQVRIAAAISLETTSGEDAPISVASKAESGAKTDQGRNEAGYDGTVREEDGAQASHAGRGRFQQVPITRKKLAIVLVRASLAAEEAVLLPSLTSFPEVSRVADIARTLSRDLRERSIPLMRLLSRNSQEILSLGDAAISAAVAQDRTGIIDAFASIKKAMEELRAEAESSRHHAHDGSKMFRAEILRCCPCAAISHTQPLPVPLPTSPETTGEGRDPCVPKLIVFVDKFARGPSYIGNALVEADAADVPLGRASSERLIKMQSIASSTYESVYYGKDSMQSLASSTYEGSAPVTKDEVNGDSSLPLAMAAKVQEELTQLDGIINHWEFWYEFISKSVNREDLLTEHLKAFMEALSSISNADSEAIRERLAFRFASFSTLWELARAGSSNFLEEVDRIMEETQHTTEVDSAS